MSKPYNKLSADLLLRLLVIMAAFHLACAWMQAFCSPWPLTDAFDLAGSFEEQLFQSLGISLSGLKEALNYKAVLSLIVKKLLEAESHQKRILPTIIFPTHRDLSLSPIQGRYACAAQ